MAGTGNPRRSQRSGRTWLALWVAAVALLAVSWVWVSRPPGWDGPVRIGFRESRPYYFVGPDGEPEGLAVDVLQAAAVRLDYPLRWVGVPGSMQGALEAGQVDIVATYPAASAGPSIHVTESWLASDFMLVSSGAGPPLGLGHLSGRTVAVPTPPGSLVYELAAQSLPGARLVVPPGSQRSLDLVCDGSVDAAFLDGRGGLASLLDRPPGCRSAVLAFAPIPGASMKMGIGSTHAAAAVADRLRSEVEELAADGSLAAIHAKWSFATANEVGSVYALQHARQRNRLWIVGVVGLTLALMAALWQVARSRQARRLAEEHARQQERYRILFERNLAGVYRTTADGRILDCNDAFAHMLGCESRDDLLRRQVWEFYPDRANREAVLARLMRDGTLTNQELVLRRADGKTAILLESATLIDPGGGEPMICEGTAVDITRQRELEDQYRQAQKLESIGRLAGGVAHDFNNTLTAINGYAELVLASLDPASPNHAMMVEIQKAGRHAESLTRQLLAFSRRQHLQPRVVNLNRVVAETRDLLRRMIGEDIELVTDLAWNLGNVKADPGQIQQVLMNLAVNARDAMPEGGRLTISTANAVAETQAGTDAGPGVGACVRLTVTDTGHGMDVETQRQVFEPFFTTKERGKGTGLGLSTVYGIVKQSGGNVHLRSGLGTGTSFVIDLPAVDEEPADGTHDQGQRDTTGTETVLVVEDQDDVRRLVTEALGRYGYRVLDADHGEAAIDLCRLEPGPIHLIISDVVMPGMMGPAVAAACQAIRPDIGVLYMSGYADNVLRGELGAGAPPAYLQKPFTPLQLASKVREVLDSRPRLSA